MKKFILFIITALISLTIYGQGFDPAMMGGGMPGIGADTTQVTLDQLFAEKDFEVLDSVSVVSFYRNDVNVGSLITQKYLITENHGQEPSHIFRKLPNIFSMNDNGTDFGYGYFRIRGLDQTRISVTLDGMPWNEAEDYGVYFANSPDLLSSMQTVKVERGTSTLNSGVSASGGSISLESIDLLAPNESYVYLGAGSFNTYKATGVFNSGRFKNSAVHVKATHQETAGYKDYGFNKSDAFTLKYGWFIDSYSSLDFITINGHHRNGQAWLGNTLDELAVNPRANGNVKEDEDLWNQSVNKIHYKNWLSENSLINLSAYLQYQSGWYNMDLDNYMTRMVDPTWETTGMRYSYGLEHYLYGANLTFTEYSELLNSVFGINYYKYQREHFMNDRVSKHFANIPVEEYYDNVGYKTDGEFFWNLKFLLDEFTLETNIQYRYVDFAYKDILTDTYYSRKDLNTSWNFINYGVNAEYNPNDNNKIYLRYCEAGREPTRTDMFGGNEFYPGELTTTKAERSYDVEAGYVLIAPKIEFNVNAYYMFFKNERILNGEYGLNGLPMHDTATNSFRTGVEISMDWNIVNGLHYSLNASKSLNKVNSETFKNKYHILTPDLTINNDIYWQGKNYKVGVNELYHSKMYMDQMNEYEIPYFFTLNFYGNYRIKNFEIGLRLNNITNRINYYNAAIGVDTLWFREAGINFFTDLKYYF